MEKSSCTKSQLVNLTRYIPELTDIIDHCPVFDSSKTDLNYNDFLYIDDIGYSLIQLNSYNFPALGDQRLFFKRSYLKDPIRVSAVLATKRFNEKRPCMILSHGSGGNTASEWQVAQRLMERYGVSVLILDHYTQRGIENTIADQFQISIESQMIDLSEAKKFMSSLNFVKENKILVAGVSRGGTVVDRLRRTRILRALGISPFSAYICFYPLPHSQDLKPNLTPEPALYIIGDQDDITPLKALQPYLEYLEKHGFSSELHIAKGAFHAFEYPANWKLGLLNLFYKPTGIDFIDSVAHKLGEWIFEPLGVVPMHKLQILKDSCYIQDENGFIPLGEDCSLSNVTNLDGPKRPFTELVDHVKNNVTYGGRIKRADARTKADAYKTLYEFLERNL